MTVKLLLAGCGKMGGAMLAGWLDKGFEATAITVVEPNSDTAEDLQQRYGIATITNPEDLDFNAAPNVVIFAVKPQVMDDVAPAYARFAGPGVVYLSIAAGKTIGYFEKMLGAEAAIVRAMPNTPAAVGRGITVCCANGHVANDQISLCGDLLSTVGEVAWVDDEEQIDIVTAVSGGGPAYVFLLAECLGQAGINAGLPEDLAKRLARVTVAGSGELLHRSSEQPETLRQNVTSPGGTTAEALRVLMADDGWQPLLDRAIAAATAKSRELA
ncbi:MAG: pyrroline-5-carboxylate reductase [Rhodospirillaceae bacterium]|nr:pyrroline-5-carboxylate reductase [Rhodospirillaceae bacterium]MBL6930105.1 pyrroline-5-carboxylate reductase [Rhodospirillales bacterium]MBL6940732.1 pyrroline-5-carboxylate reductase [Rhodospirillales bacterium]